MTIFKIGRSLDDCLRNRGMTVNKKCHNRGMTLLGFIFSLFLIFSNHSYAATYFLPDAQSEEILASVPGASIDSERCEDIGYTYYSSGQCPAYHNQDTCVFSDRYLKCDAEGWCRDNAYTITSCSSPKVVNTQCPNGLSLYKYCVCPSEYKYSCTGTEYSGGSGTACDGKYTKCNCSTYYSWNGSACAHVHSYVCPSGYKETSSGMIEPASTSKVCQLSGCSSTSGTCYKETHSHSYSCSSGYSSSCSYGYWGTASKKCSCGATSGTCYDCKSYCEANPCGSGCYTDRSCTYGCASYNSCGGCSSCESAPADPCAGVSCPSAKSCSNGCASYSSATSCCSSVCTSCNSAPTPDPDPVDPCAGVSCPTAKSCPNGCASYSTATSCCSSVCTSCKTKCEANPCNDGCYTNKSCAYGCASTNACGGCDSCKSAPACVPNTCSAPAGCSSCTDCSSCSGTVEYCIPEDSYCEPMAAVYYCCR